MNVFLLTFIDFQSNTAHCQLLKFSWLSIQSSIIQIWKIFIFDKNQLQSFSSYSKEGYQHSLHVLYKESLLHNFFGQFFLECFDSFSWCPQSFLLWTFCFCYWSVTWEYFKLNIFPPLATLSLKHHKNTFRSLFDAQF